MENTNRGMQCSHGKVERENMRLMWHEMTEKHCPTTTTGKVVMKKFLFKGRDKVMAEEIQPCVFFLQGTNGMKAG